MKSTLLAVTLAGIVASAYGQSEVKIYGVIDLSTGVTDSGSAKVYNLSSGVGNSTRLGFRGTQVLGASDSEAPRTWVAVSRPTSNWRWALRPTRVRSLRAARPLDASPGWDCQAPDGVCLQVGNTPRYCS